MMMDASDGLEIELIVHSHDADTLEELRTAAEQLRCAGHRITGRVTFEAGDAERFARDATVRQVDLVLAAGGDGTLNEVVNGIFTATAGGGPQHVPRLGVVPIGTANDLANFFGVSGEVVEAISGSVSAAVEAPGVLCDIGVLNGRYFLNVSTGGLGPEATEEAPERVKRAIGGLAYVLTGVRKFANLTPRRARFSTRESVIYEGEFLLFAVGNGGRTGGGNWLTPRADPTDGLLDLCILKPVSHTDFLRILPDLRSGDHLDSEFVLYGQYAEILIEADEAIPVNADGEPADSDTLEYSVLPGALLLALPAPEA